MSFVQTNRCSFTLAAGITSGTQTAITRTSTTSGLPGDSNGPPAGPFAAVATDGNGDFEIVWVTAGFGTTGYTVTRAAESIGGVQSAIASLPVGTVFYAVDTAGAQPAAGGIGSPWAWLVSPVI